MNKKNSNFRTWIIGVVVAIVVLIFLGFGVGGMMGGGYPVWGMMGSFGYGFSFMWIVMIILWVLIIIALVLGIMWLVRQLQK